MSHSIRRRVLVALTASLVFVAQAPPAQAQDPFSEFFGGLFGGRRSDPPHSRPRDELRVRRITPQREGRAPTYWRKPEKPRRAAVRRSDDTPTPASGPSIVAQPPAPAVPQTFFVATLGDTLGILLAGGLTESFPDHPEIGILFKAKDSTGLVRDDYFDWIRAAREIASGAQKPNVAVVMIGSNDRQPIRRGAGSLEPFSDAWNEIYAGRVDAVIAAFREKNIPIVWVGLPVMKSERFSADMQRLNEIYHARVASAGQVYVDLWDNLADDKGQYSAFGPDINGEIARLRTTDGVYLTEAGARAVAHFVATEVKKLLDAGKSPVAPARSQETDKPGAPDKPIVFRPPVSGPTAAPALPERPAIGPIQSLAVGEGEAEGESDLARRAERPPDAGAAPSEALLRHVLVEGGDQPARRNRADDASWRASGSP